MTPTRHFPFDPKSFSEQQREVLRLLSAGASVSSAAKIRGLHRSTIHNWMQKTKGFREATLSSREEACSHRREQLLDSSSAALDYLQKTLTDETVSHSVRTRIAFGLLKLQVSHGSMLESLAYGETNPMPMPPDIHRIKNSEIRVQAEASLVEVLSNRNLRAQEFDYPLYEGPSRTDSTLSTLSTNAVNLSRMSNPSPSVEPAGV